MFNSLHILKISIKPNKKGEKNLPMPKFRWLTLMVL